MQEHALAGAPSLIAKLIITNPRAMHGHHQRLRPHVNIQPLLRQASLGGGSMD
jgi:hypothetical protein